MFARPPELGATAPPEVRGVRRDAVRLMVTTPAEHSHARFDELAEFLRPGDLLVVNRSATLAASLPAESRVGSFLLNFSTRFGRELWLAEPRVSPAQPGPLALQAGDLLDIAGLMGRAVAPYPGLPRLWFVFVEGSLEMAMARFGKPIRYGYVKEDYPLEMYQTVFASIPGSAEMPSAGRPFTQEVLDSLRARGVGLAEIILHAGVSSLDLLAEQVESETAYPEPFWVFPAAAQAINAAREDGRRVIAVGTTVVRAIETAWDGGRLRPMAGFTRVYLHPGRPVHVLDGLITGFHDSATSHLALLHAFAGTDLVRAAYAEAVHEQYLWHEFGDSHLILLR
jgi:S-adenosylmethionine:tRNA ribosyltransferase-isomerase